MGSLAEKSRFLFQIDVHAGEESWRACAIVRFIQIHRQVERHHESGMSQLAQRADQRVVAKTIPAIHAPRAGCDLDDIHSGAGEVHAPLARACPRTNFVGSLCRKLFRVLWEIRWVRRSLRQRLPTKTSESALE